MNLDWLKPSATIDLTQLIYGIRPAIRTELAVDVPPQNIQRFGWRIRCFAAVDRDRFLVLSRSDVLSRRILALDRACGDHTHRLGFLLGYPPCCCRAAARVGDRGLDAWAAQIGSRTFAGRFKAIDPSGYLRGRALISHVPCSERCLPSLAMALRLVEQIRIEGCPRRCVGFPLSLKNSP